jgi:hypothetical protein
MKNLSNIQPMTEQPKNTHGGKRQGSGQKAGKKTKKTLEKLKIMEAYKQRVMKHADTIFNAQLANAKGNIFIYEVIEELNENGKKTGKKKHILVDDPHTIQEVLDKNQGQSGLVDDDYFIVTTAKPDNQAIGDMLDRTFGKATQTIAGDPENPVSILTAIFNELK